MKKTTAKYLALAIIVLAMVLGFYLVTTKLPLPEEAFQDRDFYFIDPYYGDAKLEFTSMPTKLEIVFCGVLFPLIGLLLVRHAARRKPKADEVKTRLDRALFGVGSFYWLAFGWDLILAGWVNDILTPCASYNRFAMAFCIHPDFLPIMEKYPLIAEWLKRYCYWHDSWRAWVHFAPITLAVVCLVAFLVIDWRYARLAEIED